VWFQLATQGPASHVVRTGEQSCNKSTQHRYGTVLRCLKEVGSKMSAQTAGEDQQKLGGGGGVRPTLIRLLRCRYFTRVQEGQFHFEASFIILIK
jgi:hypothetical protein